VQKFTPQLTFDNQAEEAVNFYVSAFRNSKILDIRRYTEEDLSELSRLPEDVRPGPVGLARTIRFELDGQELMAVNGGPSFEFSLGVSMYVRCETQEEIDELWDKLAENGEKQDCGWLRDQYGLSWQIAPSAAWEMMHDPDQEKAARVVHAFFNMNKLDIEGLERAYSQG
jgi:predicted 3-demethylubiquinone-9 3-methyltransferase (glyoxalase superfamily)